MLLLCLSSLLVLRVACLARARLCDGWGDSDVMECCIGRLIEYVLMRGGQDVGKL